MNLTDRVAVITGGAAGIGAASARRFAAEGAAALVLADLEDAATEAVAAAVGPSARGVTVDVSAPCPQGADTPMLADGLPAGHLGARVIAAYGAIISPDEVAAAAVAGMANP
ncbi:SDR family NAD(P)-dependent oxidoreductase [Micromonospora sp. HNM0581]|nr:SDR family NAD(P)-dependent oxidoreductase [Micromonospora sp. HNM0581]